jgi:hypothetical protein
LRLCVYVRPTKRKGAKTLRRKERLIDGH